MNNIPKICHLYWDKTPMSFLQTLTIDSFHRYNPDWKIFVYIPKNTYNGNASYIPNYIGKDFFYLVENKEYVEIKEIDINDYKVSTDLHNILRSDIFRYKILYEIGGVWSDFDVIWLRPIDYLCCIKYVGNIDINDMCGTVCMYKTTSGHHNISILIYSKGCEFLKSLIIETDNIQKLRKQRYAHQDFGTSMINRMYPTYDKILKSFSKIVALKYETFFPYSIYNMEALYESNNLCYINENVLCVHWFNGHELSKKYINKNKYENCSMTTILKNEKWI
jgi:hypothetical protein